MNANSCLSGGADGADLQWGMCAGSAGHHVVHWSFEGHRSKAPDAEVSILSKEQLEQADESVKRANKTLKRHFPTRNGFVNNLLRRNYYQIKWTQAVYAVAKLENGIVSGGTAWATQMYMDRYLFDGEPIEECHLYLFDQLTEKWFSWSNGWIEITEPPVPSGVWTGIGSRELTDAGKHAIRALLGFSPSATN